MEQQHDDLGSIVLPSSRASSASIRCTIVPKNAIRSDLVWQEEASVRWFLESVRGAIPFAAEHLDVMLRMVETGAPSMRRFLDIGAGDGLLSAVMLSRFPDAEAVLVDFSPPMLAAAAERLAALATEPRFIAADLASPAWLNEVHQHAPFDAIVSGFAIHHLSDERKRQLYAELLPLLAPGGAFAHIEHVSPERAWIREAFDAGMIDGMHDYARRRGDDRSRDEIAAAYMARLDQAANTLAPLAAQCDWLREVGFVDVAAPFRWYEIAVFGGRRPL